MKATLAAALANGDYGTTAVMAQQLKDLRVKELKQNLAVAFANEDYVRVQELAQELHENQENNRNRAVSPDQAMSTPPTSPHPRQEEDDIAKRTLEASLAIESSASAEKQKAEAGEAVRMAAKLMVEKEQADAAALVKVEMEKIKQEAHQRELAQQAEAHAKAEAKIRQQQEMLVKYAEAQELAAEQARQLLLREKQAAAQAEAKAQAAEVRRQREVRANRGVPRRPHTPPNAGALTGGCDGVSTGRSSLGGGTTSTCGCRASAASAGSDQGNAAGHDPFTASRVSRGSRG